MKDIELSANPTKRLKQLRGLDLKQRKALLNHVTSGVPIKPWPYGMPASAAPHVVLLGVSPGDGLPPEERNRGTEGRAWPNKPTIGEVDTGFDWRKDPRKYWDKASDLCEYLVQRDAPNMKDRDALALASHLNLGTGQHGVAGDAALEPKIVKWVAAQLHSRFEAKLLVCFGLWGLMRKPHNNELWKSSGGLRVDWQKPDDTSSFGNLSFRLWKTERADGRPMAVLMWPNHPNRPPFGPVGPKGKNWQAAKRQADRFFKKHGF
jgi:hypothetical protein